MSVIAPCMECPKKGCGAYHDKCEAYQKYRKSCSAGIDRKLLDGELRDMYYKRMKIRLMPNSPFRRRKG